MNYIRESFWRVLVSAGVSFFVIALLFQLVSHEGDATMRANLAEVLLRLSLPLVAIFVVCQLSQTFLRSERYRLLIAASGPNGVPSRFHMFLVTAARNMFVDMLPARLGEFSYVALLNRGHNISGQRCLTSLSLSLLFDFVALLALAVLVISLPLASSDIRGLMLATLLVVTVLVILLGLALFPGVKWAVQLSRFLPGRLRHTSFFQRLLR
ncbi:flippase-like domain-containing protein, partial [candidate division KSB1 bacterium]|nr:flippase-like domain-containing protein [candidate division KSB1 bacterium]